MDQPAERIIGGKKYVVRLMGAKRGSRLLAALSRAIGKGIDGKVSIASMAEGLTDDLFARLVDELAPFTEVDVGDGRMLALDKVLDRHFSGNYGDMLEWLIFALEVNFSSFFAALPRMLAASAQAKASESASGS